MRQYRTATPWSMTPPTGPELARTEPARAASLAADLLVPLGQAAVTGALGAGLVVFVISELAPGWSGSGLKAWAGLALAISAVAWWVLLGQTRRLLWAAERLTGWDLDRDGATGRPGPERLLMLNASRLKQQEQSAQGSKPAARGEFAAFVRLLALQGTALRDWESDIGRERYLYYRDFLLNRGLARWRNGLRPDGTPDKSEGWELTTSADLIIDALG